MKLDRLRSNARFEGPEGSKQGSKADYNYPRTKLGYESYPSLLIFYWRQKGNKDKTLISFERNLTQPINSPTSETCQSERTKKASGASVKPEFLESDKTG